jgi:hypothetical protein
MRTTNHFFNPLAGALVPTARRIGYRRAFVQGYLPALPDDLDREFERERYRLRHELDAETECYHRAHEEGWFYPETD